MNSFCTLLPLDGIQFDQRAVGSSTTSNGCKRRRPPSFLKYCHISLTKLIYSQITLLNTHGRILSVKGRNHPTALKIFSNFSFNLQLLLANLFAFVLSLTFKNKFLKNKNYINKIKRMKNQYFYNNRLSFFQRVI